MYTVNTKINNQLSIWLISMFWIVSIMIIVGGLTRLTDSGLSITKWELFSGFLPPLNQDDWIKYFDLYKKIPEFEYNIFTDDINWIKKHKLFNSAKNVFYSSNSRIDTIKTFSEMLKHNNFIISNSTFSLIPAILKENETSKIISPFPWYRKSNKELNLKQNWIKLGNNE